MDPIEVCIELFGIRSVILRILLLSFIVTILKYKRLGVVVENQMKSPLLTTGK